MNDLLNAHLDTLAETQSIVELDGQPNVHRDILAVLSHEVQPIFRLIDQLGAHRDILTLIEVL
jgi:hypothetical protein